MDKLKGKLSDKLSGKADEIKEETEDLIRNTPHSISELKDKKEQQDKIRGFKKKNPSHRGFYPQFAKGARTAFEGLALIAKSVPLRHNLKQVAGPVFQATAMYLAIALSAYVVMKFGLKKSNKDLVEFILSISPVLTIVVTLVFKKKLQNDHKMFYSTCDIKQPGFSQALKAAPDAKLDLHDKLEKLKRAIKLAAFRLFAKLIVKFLPHFKHILLPIHKFVSLKYYLGAPMSLAVALLDAIPGEQVFFEEFLLEFGESVIDAYSFSKTVTELYVSKMVRSDDKKPDTDMIYYFENRYQGYLTGLGFIYSVFMKIPLISIFITAIAEVAGALQIIDILARNQTKENAKPLLLEKMVPPYTGTDVHADSDDDDGTAKKSPIEKKTQ